MTKEKKLYSPNLVSGGRDYINRELEFFNANYNGFNKIARKISFFLHIFYWQFVFKLFRVLDILLKERTRLPFYIHENKIEIEITSKCNMKCPQCDRSCNQAATDEHMSLEQIRHFIRESVRTGKKWAFIVIIGGEPTLHPDIYEIVNMLIQYKLTFSPNTKITISTNGASQETVKILENLPSIIHQENSNKKSFNHAHFDTYNVAPADIEQYQCDTINFAKGCNIPSLSGTALTRYGYYSCGSGAAVDRVFGLDIGIKRIEDRSERAFRRQMKALCKYCGHFKDKQDDIYSLEDISPIWQMVYENYAVKSPELTLYGTKGAKEVRNESPAYK